MSDAEVPEFKISVISEVEKLYMGEILVSKVVLVEPKPDMDDSYLMLARQQYPSVSIRKCFGLPEDRGAILEVAGSGPRDDDSADKVIENVRRLLNPGENHEEVLEMLWPESRRR